MMLLAIDAVDDRPGVALANPDGHVQASLVWETARNHSVELLPNIERLLADSGSDKSALAAIFVDIGPGGYAALRVGVSIAKGLAHGLGVPIVGIGRLELDAHGIATLGPRIVAFHRAGRGELAYARYTCVDAHELVEDTPPRIIKAETASTVITAGDIVTGDVDDSLSAHAIAAGATVARSERHRVFSLVEVGRARLAAGRVDDVMALVPLYLRAPAIGPQTQVVAEDPTL